MTEPDTQPTLGDELRSLQGEARTAVATELAFQVGRARLVGTALDLVRREMVFSVFDARRLADGPVAQARMPRVMPLGLHGIFVPA